MKRRAHALDAFKTRKKTRLAPSHDADWGTEDNINAGDIPSDTKAALLLLRSLVNTKVFDDQVPAIILKHQVYSIINNKTTADQQINELRDKKEIKLFRLGKEADDFCIVFTDNYTKQLREQFSTNSALIGKFIDTVVMETTEVSLNKSKMEGFGFTDQDITQLLRGGALNVRDVGSWWLAIPCAGLFMKHFIKGRESILRTLRKSKYKEILQTELESRKLQSVKQLGMQYHIHDIIGAELVKRIQTTSGTLMRLQE